MTAPPAPTTSPDTAREPSPAQRTEQDATAAVKSLLEFPPCEPERTAVIVVDMVNHQMTKDAAMMAELERNGLDTSYYLDRVFTTVIPTLGRLLTGARSRGARIIHVRTAAYRPDCSDALPTVQEALRGWGAIEGTWACDVVDGLELDDGDLSLPKSGSGGFTSNLELHLRNMRIENLIYTGVATSGCVLATVFEGFDHGYRGYLVTDCTATTSPYLQQAAEDMVGMYLARPVDSALMLAILNGDGRV